MTNDKQPKQGGVVIAKNIRKVTEQLDKHGNIVHREESMTSDTNSLAAKMEARKKRLGL